MRQVPYPSKVDVAELPAIALAIAEEKGWAEWSLRDVAATIGVSPNALYRHIGDRDGLVVDMGARAATELTQSLRAAADTHDDPVDALVALGAAYVEFALRRPAAYDAIVQAKPSADDPRREAWHEPWLLLIEIVQRAVPDAPEATAFSLWATLHGRIDLSRSPAFPIDPRAGIDDATRAMVRAFADAGPLSSPIQPLDT